MEKETNTHSSACGFFAHPSDDKYEGNPDCLGSARVSRGTKYSNRIAGANEEYVIVSTFCTFLKQSAALLGQFEIIV